MILVGDARKRPGRAHAAIAAGLLLLHCAPAARGQAGTDGAWTGGFLLGDRWVAVNLRLNAAVGDTAARADVIFPFYGGADNAINGPVTTHGVSCRCSFVW